MGKGKNLIAGLLLALTIPTTVAGVTFTIQNPSIVKDWIKGEQVTTSTEDQKEIDELKAEIDMYKELLAEAEGDKDKIASLEAQIEEHKATISNLEKQLEEAQGNEALIEDLQQQINQQETTISELQSQLESAQEDKALITQLQQKITELENKVAELEEQLQNQEGEEVTPTSASLFTFNGNACTGYVGDNSVDQIVIPSSYSINEVEMNGAKIFKANAIPSSNFFTSITFVTPNGATQKTYTSIDQLRENFLQDFPGEVMLKEMTTKGFAVYPATRPYLASILKEVPLIFNGIQYNYLDTFLNSILASETNFSFAGKITEFVEGEDYKVTSISKTIEGTNNTGFKKYSGEIVIPSGITEIESMAFFDCPDLKSVILPSTLQKIGQAAFQRCSSLTSLKLPESLENIADGAFSVATSLIDVEVNNFTIYNQLTDVKACGYIIFYANVVKVLSSVDNGENEYLSNTSNFTKTVEGDYNVYTKVSV